MPLTNIAIAETISSPIQAAENGFTMSTTKTPSKPAKPGKSPNWPSKQNNKPSGKLRDNNVPKGDK